MYHSEHFASLTGPTKQWRVWPSLMHVVCLMKQAWVQIVFEIFQILWVFVWICLVYTFETIPLVPLLQASSITPSQSIGKIYKFYLNPGLWWSAVLTTSQNVTSNHPSSTGLTTMPCSPTGRGEVQSWGGQGPQPLIPDVGLYHQREKI